MSFITELKLSKKHNNMVEFILPIELFAQIILYLSVQEITLLLSCSKDFKNAIKSYLPARFSYPYLLTPYQEKAFNKMISASLNSICLRPVAHTGGSIILINYIYEKIQEEPKKRILVSCMRFNFIKWRNLLRRAFPENSVSTWKGNLSKFSRFLIVLTTIDNIIKEGDTLNERFHTMVNTTSPSFFPSAFWKKGLNRGGLSLNRGLALTISKEDKWTCDYFIPGFGRKESDKIIEKSSCLPFQRIEQKIVAFPSFMECIDNLMEIHEKITIVDGHHGLFSLLTRKGYLVFSSNQRKEFVSSQKGILIYKQKCLFRTNTRLEGIILMSLTSPLRYYKDSLSYPSFRCLQTVFLSNNIHTIYYFSIQKDVQEKWAQNLFNYEVETRLFLLTGSLEQESDVDPFYKYYYEHPELFFTEKDENGFVEWSSLSIINKYMESFDGEIENSKIHLLLHHYEPY